MIQAADRITAVRVVLLGAAMRQPQPSTAAMRAVHAGLATRGAA